MQLKRLYIKEYKLFKDFTYEFPADNQHYIHVLIGINGSGKSTILEAIAEIFSCVVLGEKAKFGFELEYSIIKRYSTLTKVDGFQLGYSQTFDIKLTSARDEFPVARVDVQSGYNEFSLKGIDSTNNFALPKQSIFPKLHDILPDSIIIYYSGSSEIMRNLFIPHNNRMLEKLIKGILNEPNLFHYHEPKLFNLILIGLLSYEYGDVPIYLKEKAKISGIYSIEMTLKRPIWASDSVDNFWGVKGEIRDFLNFLDSISAKDVKSIIDGSGKILVEKDSDHYISISINGNNLFAIKDYLAEEKKLFKILYALYIDELLDEIYIVLFKEENGKQIVFHDLSEGEQQALTIKGLTELLGGENTLFLFDEPDTFLHPKWQRNFIAEIEDNIDQQYNNELSYLIATHSPQILSNAKPDKTYVKIIEDGQLVEQTPKHYGREISSILYNLMGVEERNETIRKDLSKLFMLIEDEKIKEAQNELERLTEILGDTDADIQNALIQLNYLKDEEN